MKEQIKIGGRTAKELNGDYYVKFTSKEKVVRFYDKVRKVAHKKNFGGNPFEANSYSLVMIEDKEFIIHPPIHSNGDRNWTSYPEVHCYAKISM